MVSNKINNPSIEHIVDNIKELENNNTNKNELIQENIPINVVSPDYFANDIIMQGYLQKRGERGLQTWKNRYFILRGQILYYYVINDEKKNLGELKGKFSIKHAKVESTIPTKCIFSIILKDDKNNKIIRELMAQSKQEMSDWMAAINTISYAEISLDNKPLLNMDRRRMTTRIILVRHGQYNTCPINPTIDANGGLTKTGIEQSICTGNYLKNYLNKRMVTKRYPEITVIHSGMRRAKETAIEIAKNIPGTILKENTLIREAWPCLPLSTKNSSMISNEKNEKMISDGSRAKVAFRTLFKHVNPSDTFSTRSSQKLKEDDIKEFNLAFKSENTSVQMHDRYRILVCHANIIRWFVCMAMDINPEGKWGKMRLNHASITEIELDAMGNFHIGSLNQTAHLPHHLCTES